MAKLKSFTANVDFLNGPILRTVVAFSLPLLFSYLFQTLYNTVDTMIVGYALGESSLAAIGAASPIYELLIGFAVGVGSGLSLVVGRAFGRGDEEGLKKAVATASVIALFIAVIMTLIACLLGKSLLISLHTPETIINEAFSYVFYLSLFAIVTIGYNLASGVLRAVGNSFMPLIFLIVASLSNIALDFALVVFLNMGIKGAAIATVIAQAISAILSFIYIFSKEKRLVPGAIHFVFDRELYKDMLAQGLSMGLMSMIVSAGTVVLQSGINTLGEYVIAGHTAARKLVSILMLPLSALSATTSNFVSQNRGAQKYDRIRQELRVCMRINLVMTVVITISMLLFARPLVGLISGSDNSILLDNASLYLQIASPFLFVLGILTCSRNALQGMGKKVLPVISSVIEMIGKFAFTFIFVPRFHYMAVIFCEPVIWCLMTVELVFALYTLPEMKKAKNK